MLRNTLLLILLLCTACQKKPQPTVVDVAPDFIKTVSGRSYGAEGFKFSINSNGIFTQEVDVYESYKQGEKLGGEEISSNMFLSCNLVATGQIEVTRYRKPTTNAAPITLRYKNVKLSVNSKNPIRRYERHDSSPRTIEDATPEQRAQGEAYCQKMAEDPKSAARVWGGSIESFSSAMIHWRRYSANDIYNKLREYDVAEGATIDMTDFVLKNFAGKWVARDQSELIISNAKARNMILLSVDKKFSEDYEVSTITSASLDTERKLSLYFGAETHKPLYVKPIGTDTIAVSSSLEELESRNVTTFTKEQP